MQELPRVRPGEPISAKWANDVIDHVNLSLRIRTDGTIRMSQTSAGLCLSAALPPQPFFFQLTQDTPAGQGYVTARPLIWMQATGQYATSEFTKELQIYDRISAMTYGNGPMQGPSQWTKKGFIGQAFWTGDKGQWQIREIQHVARKINFTLAADLNAGDSQVDGNVTSSWDGLNPTVSIPGVVNLLSSPTKAWNGKKGANGSATWADTTDNSQKWQYQIDDLDCST